jgi:signal peptidase I
MFQLLKVTGESLSPFFQPGDFILILKSPFVRRLKMGDIVVFDHPVYGTLVKKVSQVNPLSGEFFVLGAQEESTDSRQFGWAPAAWLRGKVIRHFKKPS